MNQSSFTFGALEQMRWIDRHFFGATESERQALIGARAVLMKLIQSERRNQRTPGMTAELGRNMDGNPPLEAELQRQRR